METKWRRRSPVRYQAVDQDGRKWTLFRHRGKRGWWLHATHPNGRMDRSWFRFAGDGLGAAMREADVLAIEMRAAMGWDQREPVNDIGR